MPRITRDRLAVARKGEGSGEVLDLFAYPQTFFAVSETHLMQPADELHLQQLLQMQFWQRRSPDSGKLRPSIVTEPDPVDLPKEWELTRGITLHSWQQQCVEGWFAADKRGVIKVVTGAGKTMLALAIIEKLQRNSMPGLRVAIVVPTIVLLDQWREEFLARSNLPESAIGLLGAGQNAAFDHQTRILICVLNSAAKRLPALVDESGFGPSLLLVVDECHRAGAAEMQKVFQTNRAFSLGLSATPERESDEDTTDEPGDHSNEEACLPVEFENSVVGKELGPVIFELNYSEAIRLGVLPPFQISPYGLSLKPHESVKYERVSREIKDLRKELERPGRRGLGLIRWCRSPAGKSHPAAARLMGLTSERKRLLFRMEARAEAVLRILREAFAENAETKAILFHESIDEVMRLFLLLRAEGFTVVAEHSEFPDQMRAASLRLFRAGAAQIIASARSLIEGFNVPSADVGIIVAASSSVRQRVQTLGRLLRKTQAVDGSEKHAVLNVLYASKTVDEMIYEKADWEHFVGAERNRYFLWPDVEHAPPMLVEKAPRYPAPDELSVDESALRPGETYPGNVDQGLACTRDSQGTIRTEEGRLIEPHPELFQVLKKSLKSAGRFRITPARRFVLELEKTGEAWRGIYLGKLSASVSPLEDPVEAHPDRDWQAGDSYPLAHAFGRTFSVLQRDPRLIALKAKGRIRFVPSLDAIPDVAKRTALSRIQSVLKSAYAKGHRISKIAVTWNGHVVYVFQNQAFFVGYAPEGEEGFLFEN
jgi:superfamily II DNA or RNA helicase